MWYHNFCLSERSFSLFEPQLFLSSVMAGLDPAIHENHRSVVVSR